VNWLLSHQGKPYLLISANKIAAFNIEMSASEAEMEMETSNFENMPSASQAGGRRRRTHRRRSHRNRRNRRNNVNMSMRNRKNRRNTRRNRNRRNRNRRN
jgi:hypothetical protein